MPRRRTPGLERRNRKPNWLPQEVQVLLDNVEKHHEVLLQTVNDNKVKNDKQKVWQIISEDVSEVCGLSRNFEECRTKWKDLKAQALRQVNDKDEQSSNNESVKLAERLDSNVNQTRQVEEQSDGVKDLETDPDPVAENSLLLEVEEGNDLKHPMFSDSDNEDLTSSLQTSPHICDATPHISDTTTHISDTTAHVIKSHSLTNNISQSSPSHSNNRSTAPSVPPPVLAMARGYYNKRGKKRVRHETGSEDERDEEESQLWKEWLREEIKMKKIQQTFYTEEITTKKLQQTFLLKKIEFYDKQLLKK